MNGSPRFFAEMHINECIVELHSYSDMFSQRVARAFDNLHEEAERLQHEEYDRLRAFGGDPDMDSSWIAEAAHDKAVDFYITTNAIRLGVMNLMVAGLFHMFEQQAAYLVDGVLPRSKRRLRSKYAKEKLQQVLHEQSIDVKKLKNWPLVVELNLVANVVKHGDGDSANKLKRKKAILFKGRRHEFMSNSNAASRIRPLVGKGLQLTENDFAVYAKGLCEFWRELTEALWNVFRPTQGG